MQPTTTDWLMVVITFVYVVATIVICVANFKSAKASKEQLIEMKRQYEGAKQQYEETKRLNMMPYISLGIGNELHDYDFELKLSNGERIIRKQVKRMTVKNVGCGAAKDISFYWKGFGEEENLTAFPITSMQSGEEKKIHIIFLDTEVQTANLIARGRFTYQDLLNNDYYQDVEFVFEKTGNVKNVTEYGVEKPILLSEEK